MLYTTDKGKKPHSDDRAVRKKLAYEYGESDCNEQREESVRTANVAVASSKPWCLKSRIDPDTMLDVAARIGAIADVTEAYGSIVMRILALGSNSSNQ